MKSKTLTIANTSGNIVGLRLTAIELSLVVIKLTVIKLKSISRKLGFSLVALLIVGLQSPNQAESAGPILSLQEAHLAVWQMHNPDAEPADYDSGTATFVGTRLAITNYHVLKAVLTNTSPPEVALSQKGSSKTLRIHRVLAISRIYDLALFETTKPGNGYLELANHRETSLEQLKQLTLLGYPKASFRTMKQKEQTQVLHESEWHYSIALEAPHHYRSKDSKGSSGGPLLNTQGQIMGIVSESSYNLTFGIKLEHLRNLILAGTKLEQELWWLTLCTNYEFLGYCFRAGIDNIHDLAEQGHPIAQYRLWLLHGESPTGISWLQESADNGFSLSLLDLAYLLTDDTNSDEENAQVFHLTQKAAEQHLATAQTKLAKMFLKGIGVSRNKPLAIYWLERAADQGLNSANKALNRP